MKGSETHGLNPNAVRVMAEVGVDIHGQRSRHVDEFADIDFDYVITCCQPQQRFLQEPPAGPAACCHT